MIGGGINLTYDRPDAINGEQDRRKQDIGEILQQIMAITDQSLDEAQARSLKSPKLIASDPAFANMGSNCQ